MYFDGSYFIVGLLEVVKLEGGVEGLENTEKWGTGPKKGGRSTPSTPLF